MRVGIDYRILTVGPQLIGRGMPRYTQQQLRAVLGLDTENEYVLLANSGDDLGLVDPAVRSAPNVTIRSFPGTANPRYPAQGDLTTLLARSEEYQDWIWAQGIDLYHATTPFLLHEPVVAQFDACPVVATFYDVIPLVFPKEYLGSWPVVDEYLRTIMLLRRCQRLLAISEWSRRDALYYLGIDPERVDVAWPVADPWFRPMTPDEVERALAPLRRRMRVPESFVLTVTHLHHSKNLRTLLAAYALLPSALRSQLPLVVACAFDEASDRDAHTLIDELDLSDDVVLTGLVTNDELSALYNTATMLAHPSRYEGFGLPVVEAMRCDTPVVTTTTSSLPEVAGDAAVLVDPESPEAFADAISTLAGDADLRRELSIRGRDRAALFSTEALGRRTLACYLQTLEDTTPAQPVSGRPEPCHRPRIALWSPIPPQETGVAGFGADLADSLSGHAEVEVFVDDGVIPEMAVLARCRVLHHRAFERRRRQQPFDAVIYQLGGHASHLFGYRAMTSYPGIADLHDLTLSHLLYTDAHAKGDMAGFRTEVAAVEGSEAATELDAIEELRGPTHDEALSEFLFRFPMLGRVVGASPAQVVHYPTAGVELKLRYPHAEPSYIPLGVAWRRGIRPRLERMEARSRLGIGESTFVAGAFGVVHPFKRIEACLRALPTVIAGEPAVLLVVVGTMASPEYERHLRDLARELGVASHVRFTGRVAGGTFDDYMVASDVVLNLRHPFMKQMSATLVRAFAAGRPAFITDVPAWSAVPDGCCLRIGPGPDEADQIAMGLSTLARDRSLRDRMSSAARAHFDKEGTIEHMSHRYLELIAAGAGS